MKNIIALCINHSDKQYNGSSLATNVKRWIIIVLSIQAVHSHQKTEVSSLSYLQENAIKSGHHELDCLFVFPEYHESANGEYKNNVIIL